MQNKKPSLAYLEFLLKQRGIVLSPNQLAELWRYHSLIRNRNQDRELTRIINFESVVLKHYVDCMVVGNLFHIPSPLLDIGTGAGFPGVCLKIRYPKLQIFLAEPRPKKVAFLREVISSLGLTGIEVFEHKVVSKSFKTLVSGVITRALEPIYKTMLRTSACLQKSGTLIFMKGPSVDPEIEEAKRCLGDQFSLILNHSYRLPKTDHLRRLVVFQKNVDVVDKRTN